MDPRLLLDSLHGGALETNSGDQEAGVIRIIKKKKSFMLAKYMQEQIHSHSLATLLGSIAND